MSFIKDLLKWGAVRGSRDPVTGGIGLSGPHGILQNTTSSPNTIVLLGDSMTSLAYYSNTFGSLTQSNGLATASVTSHGLYDGQYIRVAGSDQSGYNILTPITWVNANTFTFPVAETTEATATGSTLIYYRLNHLSCFGYFNIANARMGSRFNMLNMGGVGGRKTSDVLANIQADCLSFNPSWTAVWCGINDLMASVSVSTVTENLRAIYAALLGRNIKVIALTVLPLETGHASYSAAMQETIMEVNAWIRKYVYATPGMFLVDAFAAVVDPASATAQPRTGYLKTDHIHTSETGAAAVGNAVYDLMNGITPSIDTLVSSLADNYGTNAENENILDAGTFQGSGGALSGAGAAGTVATGWTLKNLVGTPTSTGTVVARTVSADGDAIGNNQVATISGAASGNVVQILGPDIKSRLTTGQKFYLEGHLQMTGASAVSEINLSVQVACNSGAITVYSQCNYQPGVMTYPQGDISYRLRSPTIAMPDPTKTGTGAPGNIANVQVYAWIKFNGSGGAVMKLGRVSLRKTT